MDYNSFIRPWLRPEKEQSPSRNDGASNSIMPFFNEEQRSTDPSLYATFPPYFPPRLPKLNENFTHELARNEPIYQPLRSVENIDQGAIRYDQDRLSQILDRRSEATKKNVDDVINNALSTNKNVALPGEDREILLTNLEPQKEKIVEFIDLNFYNRSILKIFGFN